MGTAMPFLYSVGILFSVIGIIASYILHRKVRKSSTLVILIGYLLSVIPSFGEFVLNCWKTMFKTNWVNLSISLNSPRMQKGIFGLV